MSINTRAHPRLTAGSFLLLTVVAGCGPETPMEPTTAEETVAEALQSYGSWEAFSPPLAAADEPSGAEVLSAETVDEVDYVCSTVPYSLTSTPDEIVMYSPNASIMWLGNLIQGRSYVDGLGSFQEWSVRQRAPLRVSIDLLTADNFAVVDDPSLTSVQSAIGGLIQRASAAGHKAGSSINFEHTSSHSVRQAALELGLSARYLGSSAELELEVERNASQRTITAHFVQKMFTVAVELPQSPSDFFSEAFTAEVLAQEVARGNVGSDNLPVYIANIVYGRTLTYSLTSTHSESRMRAAIEASFNGLTGGGSGYSEVELRETLSQQNLKVQAIGGEGQNVLELISSGRLREYFAEDADLTSARPLSYQLNNLGDNSIAKVGETTSYNLRTCEPFGDIVSGFETDTEGWGVRGDATDPIRTDDDAQVEQWSLRATDNGPDDFLFRAPGKFRGDKSEWIGGELRYWYQYRGGSATPNNFADVRITGSNGVTIYHKHPESLPFNEQWKLFSVDLVADRFYRSGSPSTVSEELFAEVMADIVQLEILGARQMRRQTIYLDHVELRLPRDLPPGG